jgi:hypothetical protein
MATRFYFPETEAAPVTPPGPGAEWEHINSLQRKAITVADSSTLTSTAYSPDAADDLTDKDAHHRQYVTDALAAQSVSGNLTGQFQCFESNAGNNLKLTVKLYVVSNDGSTAKETLLAITRATTELGTALANRTFQSVAITGATLEEGDRLVFEVGLGGLCTSAGGVQGHNGTIRWGCNASGGDLAVNETETGTTFRGWMELSGTLTFFVPATVSLVTWAPYKAKERFN